MVIQFRQKALLAYFNIGSPSSGASQHPINFLLRWEMEKWIQVGHHHRNETRVVEVEDDDDDGAEENEKLWTI